MGAYLQQLGSCRLYRTLIRLKKKYLREIENIVKRMFALELRKNHLSVCVCVCDCRLNLHIVVCGCICNCYYVCAYDGTCTVW